MASSGGMAPNFCHACLIDDQSKPYHQSCKKDQPKYTTNNLENILSIVRHLGNKLRGYKAFIFEVMSYTESYIKASIVKKVLHILEVGLCHERCHKQLYSKQHCQCNPNNLFSSKVIHSEKSSGTSTSLTPYYHPIVYHS